MKSKTKRWSVISTAMNLLGAHSTFTQPAAYRSVQEILLQLKATLRNTPGQLFLCIPQAHALVCLRTLTVQEGLGLDLARHVLRTLIQKSIYNNLFSLECLIGIKMKWYNRSRKNENPVHHSHQSSRLKETMARTFCCLSGS